MRRHTTKWIAAVLTALCVPAAAGPFSGRLILTFDDALAAGRGGVLGPPAAMNVYATCNRGAWSDLWAEAQGFNRAAHKVLDVQAEAKGDTLTGTLKMDIGSDPWIKGGPAEYTFSLRIVAQPAPGRAGRVEGTFTGLFKGPVDFRAKGRVTGEVLAIQAPKSGYKPVALGERPRLLFRGYDLPRIRKRMDTPLGKAILARLRKSSDAMALGLLYQLTGEKQYADRAGAAARKKMAETGGGPFAIGRVWGYRLMPVAYAYDCCYDAWAPKLRKAAEDWMDRWGYLALFEPKKLGPVNMSPGSNYIVVLYPGGGLAAMALWGQPGPKPLEPTLRHEQVVEIPASASEEPVAGVPVNALTITKMPLKWLRVGPFKPGHGEDGLASMGGMANARPTPGMKVTCSGKTAEWFVLPDKWAHSPNPKADGLDLVRVCNKAWYTTSYYFAYLTNDAERLLEVKLGHVGPGNASMYIAGRRFAEGDFVKLPKGTFPVLIRAYIEQCQDWGTIWMVPQWFEPPDEARRQALLAKRTEQNYWAWKRYERDRGAWEDTNGGNLRWMKMVTRAERVNYLNLMLGMGLGGFQGEGEGYTLECHWPLYDYALAYANYRGVSFPGRPTISHFVPRYVMTTVFPGRTSNGRPVAINQSFGRGSGTPDEKYLARTLPLVPDEWRPAVLWFYLKRIGATIEDFRDEARAAKLVASGKLGGSDSLVWTFLTFPLDLDPVNPGQVMPRAWEAKTRGFYAFRNAWAGKDDIVAQFYAKSGVSCGWNQAEAACFQIHGLGHAWAWKESAGEHGKTGSRWYDNVVMLPDDPVNCGARPDVAYARLDPATGGGVVTVDMNKVYLGREKKKSVDIGIRGLRSFAADYSGASGAPALFAVADRITGGKRKLWVFQPPRQPREGPGPELTIAGNRFTIRQPDGTSMTATFVSPPDVKIRLSEGKLEAHKFSGVPAVSKKVLLASGGANDDSGEFLVVMTLQTGDVPAVKISGSGLKAVATIGKQTVRFDGEKLVLGAK